MFQAVIKASYGQNIASTLQNTLSSSSEAMVATMQTVAETQDAALSPTDACNSLPSRPAEGMVQEASHVQHLAPSLQHALVSSDAMVQTSPTAASPPLAEAMVREVSLSQTHTQRSLTFRPSMPTAIQESKDIPRRPNRKASEMEDHTISSRILP